MQKKTNKNIVSVKANQSVRAHVSLKKKKTYFASNIVIKNRDLK